MPRRTRIKICGITRPRDAASAARLGADAIGLVFYPPSPRFISIEQAQSIVAALPPFVTRVGLFMDAGAAAVEAVLDAVSLDCLQFHGAETPDYCESFARPYIKSVPMMEQPDLRAYTAGFASASGFLLDAVRTGEAGGSGAVFEWRSVPRDPDRPLILAGGLNGANVAEAIRLTGCYAVDVSSGVESEKGIKSDEKMQQFIEQVNRSE